MSDHDLFRFNEWIWSTRKANWNEQTRIRSCNGNRITDSCVKWSNRIRSCNPKRIALLPRQRTKTRVEKCGGLSVFYRYLFAGYYSNIKWVRFLGGTFNGMDSRKATSFENEGNIESFWRLRSPHATSWNRICRPATVPFISFLGSIPTWPHSDTAT